MSIRDGQGNLVEGTGEVLVPKREESSGGATAAAAQAPAAAALETMAQRLAHIQTLLGDEQQRSQASRVTKKQLEEYVAEGVGLLDTLTLDPEAREVLGKVFTDIAAKTGMGSDVPSYINDVRLAALQQGNDQKGVVSKIVARIKKFDGKDPKYTWAHFWAEFSVAVQNASYRDYELRTIFLSCLDGGAMEHYRAFSERYVAMGYDQLVTAFAERYDTTKRMGINSLIGISQGSNEDVLSFRDRLLNTARPLMPMKPSAKRIIRDNAGKDVIMDNTSYSNEMIKYNAARVEHDTYLIRFFVMGLRDDIVQRLQTTEFDTLDQACAAAKNGEDYLKSVSQLRTHHLRMAVNAASAHGRDDRGRSTTGFDSKSNSACHECGKEGHWRNECPNLRNRSKSNSGRKTPSGGYGLSTDTVLKEASRLVREFSKALQETHDVRPKDHTAKKGKSFKKGKKPSVQRGRSQERGSRGSSRGNSRGNSRGSSRGQSRSGTPDGGRQGSRYGSQSNSRSGSKNGRR
jgi:hypothetical protein